MSSDDVPAYHPRTPVTRADRARRRATLYAALGFCQLPPAPDMPEIVALQSWMLTWRGIGDIVVGMERQGYAVSLRRLVDDGWSAAFAEHRLIAPVGTANAPTPFRAVVDAAWAALNATPLPTPGVEMVEEVL